MKKRYCLSALFFALGIMAASLLQWWINKTPETFERGEISVIMNGCTVPSSQESVLKLIEGYFSMRCGSFAKAGHIEDKSVSADKDLNLSKIVQKNEIIRVKKLRNMMNGWDCHYSYAGADLRIDGWKDDGETIVCSVYEFIWFKSWYQGHTLPASADLSGYSVRHVLGIQQKEGGFLLTSDYYDEGRPTFAATDGRLDNTDYTAYAGIPSAEEPVCKKKAPALNINSAKFDTDYRPMKTIAYADKWTPVYNPLFPNLESVGGDCCNFVSQCLYAGGLPLTRNWRHNGKQMGTSAWISSTQLYAKLTGAAGEPAVGRGVAVLRQDDNTGRYVRFGEKRIKASDIFFPGSPVFYRWNGGFASDSRWNHMAVCVGTMGDGTPAVSCHTDEKYHIKWNYGGENCDYGTVQLTPVSMY